jgi:phosphatidylglycerol lysyltransferase
MQYGWNATSYQIVNPGISHWFSRNNDAVVGFTTYAGVRVVAGAPVCSIDGLPDVIDEFESDARQSHQRVCYFGGEARLEHALLDDPSHSRVLLGAQPAWNPARWDEIISSHKSLRAQLNRARNKGVTVVEFAPREAETSEQLRSVLHRWLSRRGLPPLHFLVEPDTIARLEDRRVFVAKNRAGDPIAFAVLSPIAARNGWLVEQFPRLHDSPNGTVELLLTTAVRAIAESGASYVTLGLAPLARRDQIDHSNEPLWVRATLGFAALHGRRFYNFGGLESFKSKFAPEVWEPVYAIEAAPHFTPRALYAIAGAFASRSPLTLLVSAIVKAIKQELSWLVD